METAQNFRQAVEMTREQFGGITLDLMARILASVLDEAELKALIRDLETQAENKTLDQANLNAHYDETVGLSEDDAMEREHMPVEYYVEPQLPSERNY